MCIGYPINIPTRNFCPIHICPKYGFVSALQSDTNLKKNYFEKSQFIKEVYNNEGRVEWSNIYMTQATTIIYNKL